MSIKPIGTSNLDIAGSISNGITKAKGAFASVKNFVNKTVSGAKKSTGQLLTKSGEFLALSPEELKVRREKDREQREVEHDQKTLSEISERVVNDLGTLIAYNVGQKELDQIMEAAHEVALQHIDAMEAKEKLESKPVPKPAARPTVTPVPQGQPKQQGV